MKTVIALCFLLSCAVCSAEKNHTIGQKDKAFTQASITIDVGDTIEFVNEDPYFHNVFSLSDAALFDLGSYPKGESKSVTFSEVGTVEVECAIHPNMVMEVIVK